MILDSSFLVSFFRQHDENHRKAVEIAGKSDKEEKLLPELIYFETLTVINYKEGIAAAKEVDEYLVANQHIRLYAFSEEEKQEMLAGFFAQERQLSIEDASVIYLARKTGSKALAFDDRLIKAIEKPA